VKLSFLPDKPARGSQFFLTRFLTSKGDTLTERAKTEFNFYRWLAASLEPTYVEVLLQLCERTLAARLRARITLLRY